MISNCLGKYLCNLEFSDIHKYCHLCFSYAVSPCESPEPGRLASPLSQQKIPDGFQFLYVTHIHFYSVCLKSSIFFSLLFRSNASSKSTPIFNFYFSIKPSLAICKNFPPLIFSHIYYLH